MVEVPALLECPTCGLPVEAGNGPGNLAWHDCGWILARKGGEPTGATEDPWDRIAESVAAAVVERAPGMPGRDLAAILEAVASRPAETSGAGVSQTLLDWLSEDIPDDPV